MSMTYTLEQIEATCKAATPGWRKGKYSHCIVTDLVDPNVLSDDGNREVYGGSLIAESMFDVNRVFAVMARTALPELCARVRELEAENKRLHEISVGDIHFNEDDLNIKLGGVGALIFMNFVVDIFKSNGGENFLTFGIADKDHKYSVTIQNCDGELTPAQKMEELEAENAALRTVRDAVVEHLKNKEIGTYNRLLDAIFAAQRPTNCEQGEGGAK